MPCHRAIGHAYCSVNQTFVNMADDDDQLCTVAVAAAVVTGVATSDIIQKRKQQKCSMWTIPLFLKRCEYGQYNLLMAELRASDFGRFRSFTQFTVEGFDELLGLVKDNITGSAWYRLPIPADMRLAVTLRYLATGESFELLIGTFNMMVETRVTTLLRG